MSDEDKITILVEGTSAFECFLRDLIAAASEQGIDLGSMELSELSPDSAKFAADCIKDALDFEDADIEEDWGS